MPQFSGHKAAMRTNLQPQFFSERLALFEVLEEFIENADNDGIDADAFRFSHSLSLLRLLRRHGGAGGW